jgi:hypothetical protein
MNDSGNKIAVGDRVRFKFPVKPFRPTPTYTTGVCDEIYPDGTILILDDNPPGITHYSAFDPSSHKLLERLGEE